MLSDRPSFPFFFQSLPLLRGNYRYAAVIPIENIIALLIDLITIIPIDGSYPISQSAVSGGYSRGSGGFFRRLGGSRSRTHRHCHAGTHRRIGGTGHGNGAAARANAGNQTQIGDIGTEELEVFQISPLLGAFSGSMVTMGIWLSPTSSSN